MQMGSSCSNLQHHLHGRVSINNSISPSWKESAIWIAVWMTPKWQFLSIKFIIVWKITIKLRWFYIKAWGHWQRQGCWYCCYVLLWRGCRAMESKKRGRCNHGTQCCHRKSDFEDCTSGYLWRPVLPLTTITRLENAQCFSWDFPYFVER